jgi:hypothetical protein
VNGVDAVAWRHKTFPKSIEATVDEDAVAVPVL